MKKETNFLFKKGMLLALFFLSVNALLAQSWRQVPTNLTSNNYQGIYFLDANKGWAVGFGGKVIATNDGGSTWTNQTTSSSSYLLGVYFADASNGWAIGTNGGIIATTDGGSNWVSQTSGMTGELDDIYFVSSTKGWIAGGSGILYTNNGGTTWTNQYSTATMRGVSFVDANNGWAVGINGKIIKTTNGGSTWTDQTSGTTQSLWGVKFISTTKGWAVGSNGTILTTSDGGANWTAQTSGTTNFITSIYFLDANQGLAVSYNGAIYATTNGGTTWTAQATGYSSSLFRGSFLNASQAWVAGSNNTILKYCTNAVITSEPSNVDICLNANTSFSVAATGNNLTYLWQIKASGGSTWNDAVGGAFVGSSYTSNTLELNGVYSAYDNASIRCIVKGDCTGDTSRSAIISIKNTKINTQPNSVSICLNGNTSFNVAASGINLTYLWQIRGAGGSNWNNAVGGAFVGTTYTTSTLQLNSVYSAYNNASIRCIVSGTCNNDTTQSATITIKTASTSSTTISICPSSLPYSWNGLTFNVAGSQTAHLTNAAGCDSAATLNLSVGSTTSSSTTVVNCGSYSWNGLTYAASGTYSKSFTNAGGCDSVATLNLTIVSTLPNIGGANAACAGSTTTLTNAVSGGVWFTQATSQATIHPSTGLVTAKYAGTITIQYSKTGCGSVTKTFTVNPIPGVPTIGYASGTNIATFRYGADLCKGKSFTVVGTPAGGSWAYSNPAVGTITSGGVVNLLGVGTGAITYTYTNANGCTNSRTTYGTVGNCPIPKGVSMNNEKLASIDFAMYPNPAKGSIHINIETLVGEGSIVVTDLYGKTIKIQTLSMGANTVDIANLSKGFYLVSTITKEGKTTKKLVVE